MTGLVVSLLLAAAPCTRVVVTPFQPLATTPAVAREVEEQVRALLAARPGLCVERRQDTIARLAVFEGHRLPPCADARCFATQLGTLEADELLGGVVVGVGARRNVDLISGNATRTARLTTLAESREQLAGALSLLLRWEAPSVKERRRWPAVAAAVAGVASAGVGVALGVESRRLEQALSAGGGGCAGGPGFPSCFDAQLRTGRDEATAANVLFGVAGVLAAGAVVLWVVELP